jgi:hypothetical protein
VHAHVQRQQDFFLGREVVVDRRLRDAEPFRDLAYGSAVEALVGEQVQGDVEDLLARGCARLVAAAPVTAGRAIPGRRPAEEKRR